MIDTTYVDPRDLPECCQRILGRARRAVWLHLGPKVSIGGPVSDHSRTTCYFIKDGQITDQQTSSWGGANMFTPEHSRQGQLDYGFELTLTPGQMVFKTSTSGYHTLYAHPDDVAKMLPPPEELTRDEKIVLAATATYISSARLQEAQYYTDITHERYQSAKQSLITKKLLKKNGAITTKGRNAAPRLEALRKT